MTAPSVSIVTPVLNRAETIEACLRSVVGQNYPDIEHIVVDGGSTDGTLDVLRSFEGRYRMKWLSEPDDGMYDAINKGLDLTSGDVLAYLNSDDLYLPWSVQAAVAALDGGSDVVFGDLGVLKLGDAEPIFYPQFYRPFDLNYYTHVATLAQPTVFWKRAVTERIGGFDSSYRLLGDCDYWIRAALAGSSFAHVDEILAVQVEHDETLRAVHADRLKQEFMRLRTEHEQSTGPAKHVEVRTFGHKLRWRRDQLRFAIAARSQNPRRWKHFASFLHEHEIRVAILSLGWYLLPGSLRPKRSSMLDAEALKDVFYKGERHGAGT